jgi:hypothetical protein
MPQSFSTGVLRFNGAVLSLILVLSTNGAQAEIIKLGNHSKEDIRAHCEAAGGTGIEGTGGKGYGCFNPKNNTAVICNDNQQCGGYVPSKP